MVDGGKHVSCRYVSHRVDKDGAVTIRTLLKAADGREDKLDWVFRPVQRRIAGRSYVGFAYRYEVDCLGQAIMHIKDRATWELGGRALGVTVVNQYAYNMDNVFTITRDNTFAGRGGTRFCRRGCRSRISTASTRACGSTQWTCATANGVG